MLGAWVLRAVAGCVTLTSLSSPVTARAIGESILPDWRGSRRSLAKPSSSCWPFWPRWNVSAVVPRIRRSAALVHGAYACCAPVHSVLKDRRQPCSRFTGT